MMKSNQFLLSLSKKDEGRLDPAGLTLVAKIKNKQILQESFLKQYFVEESGYRSVREREFVARLKLKSCERGGQGKFSARTTKHLVIIKLSFGGNYF